MHGHPLAAASSPLRAAERSIQGDSRRREVPDGRADRDEDRIGPAHRCGSESPWGGDRIVGVEALREQRPGGRPVLRCEPPHRLAPQEGADRAQVGPAVPPGQHLGGGVEIDPHPADGDRTGGATPADDVVAQQFRAQAPIAEHGVDEVIDGHPAALGQRHHGEQVLTRPEAERGPLRPAEPRVSLQRFCRVGQPVRVVGVDHEVGALELRQRVGGLESRGSGPWHLDPFIARVAAVEHRDAVLDEQRCDQVGGDPIDEPGRRLRTDLRCRRCVGVPDTSGAIGGQGVDPRQALHVAEHRSELVEVMGLVHPDELFEHRVVVGVGVPIGEAGLEPPTQQGQVDHRAVMGPPGGAFDRARRAVLAEDLDAAIGRCHVTDLVAVAVAGGRAGGEVEAVEREAMTVRERVRPRHAVVEADLHAGCAEQRDAVHVELTGDREVALPEPGLAVPGEVGVGQHHAVPRRREIAPDGPAVAGEGVPAECFHR